MTVQLQMRHEADGGWLLSGLPRRYGLHFQDLHSGLAYAKDECAAAPATIEVISDGVHIWAHQSEGWPQELSRPHSDTSYRGRPDRQMTPSFTAMMRERLDRLLHLFG